MKYKLVKILWDDAQTRNATLSIDEVKKDGLGKAVTIGYLIDENKERIAVCGFIFPDEKTEDGVEDSGRRAEDFTGFRDVHFIPKKSIKRRIELREK